MATLNGARALGLEHSTGSIEPGKWAALACVDMGCVNSQPVYDIISQLVYTAAARQVTDVWIAGRRQLENGRLTHIDSEALLGRCNEWRDRIATADKQIQGNKP
jgi:5-methylthioadenosine/S-adenosylhomocysteine deaminase